MIYNRELSELFENAVTRSNQLAALAVIVHDTLDTRSIDKKALQDTMWLMTELLEPHREAIVQMPDLN